jgi:exopolysaccharide biosynthesis polyprenyl glycosylphosphotransferase
MSRAVAHYLPREIAVLGLVELTLSFAVIHTVVQAATTVELIPSGDMVLAALLTVAIGAIAVGTGLYRPDVCLERKRLLIATGLAGGVIFALLLFIGAVPHNELASRRNTLYMAEVIAAWFATMALIRVGYGLAIRRRSVTRRILILGESARVDALSERLRSRRGRLFDPVRHDGRSVSWPMLRQQGIWRVVVASQPGEAVVESLMDCKLRGMRILSAASFQENYLGRIDLDALSANSLLLGQDFSAGTLSAALKRLCDIGVAIGMIILLLPLMVITALAVKVDSPGPIFYRQQRVGQFGKTFTLFKFRSMTVDAEASGSPIWAQQQDPRVTRVGRFIRATRIDELPQLANVISGEMSLVGPRPERPHFVEQLARAIPFYRQRAYAKPGLTGWAQVNFPYGASVEDAREKLAYDLYYAKNRTFMLDAIILVSTIRVVLFREGAR